MHDSAPARGAAPAAPARPQGRSQTCLACLATDVRMCNLEQYNLGKSYAALVGYQCGAEEGMPNAVCYECARKLNKFKAFRAMSRRAYSILQGLLKQHNEISDSNIRDVDRKKNNLESTLTQFNLGHLEIEPVKVEMIDVSSEGENVEKKYNSFLNKLEDEDAEGHVVAKEELKSVVELEIEFEHDYVNELTLSQLPAPEEEDVKRDIKPIKCPIKPIKSDTDRSRRTKAGSKKVTVKQEKAGKRSTRSNEGEKAVKRKRKADNSEVITEVPVVKPKYTRKKPDAKQHTLYTKEYYEKMAVVTIMTHEEQLEFFKQSRSKDSHLPYRCETCGLYKSNEFAYEAHVKRHEPSAGDVVCDICKLCYNKKRIAKHICMLHRTKFECRKCDFVTTLHQNLRQHVTNYHDTPFFCDVCETTFDKLEDCTEHVYDKHPASMSCTSCGVTVFTLAALKRHRARAHHSFDISPTKSSSASGVPCAQCGVVFRNEEAYKVHRTTYPGHDTEHGLIECGACSEHFEDVIELRKHMDKHKQQWPNKSDGDRFKCEQCGEHFNNGREYFFHFRQAHPGMTRTRYFGQEDPLICELCGKVFQKSFLYQRHMDDHNGLKRKHFKCDYCHKTFADQNYLNVHRTVHTRKNPYECDICDMTFAVRNSLIVHKRTHTKEQPYQCEICKKRFADRSNLTRHTKYVHSDATHFNCEICGKSFKERSTILAHVKHVHEKIPWPKRDRTRPKRKRADTSNDIEELT